MLSNLTVCIAAFDIKKHLDGVRPNSGKIKPRLVAGVAPLQLSA